MTPNPRVPSRLGCGGLLLLLLSFPIAGFLPAVLIQGLDMTSGGLHVGDDRYLIGDSWWVFAIVAVISVVAVFRLGMGRRDWLATFAASGWVAIGAGYAIGTDQYGLLALSALILFLVGTGTVRDRRALGGD